MKLLKDTEMEVGWHVWQARPAQSSITVVVKGTFTLVPDAPCPLASVQALPRGDEHHDDDVERSLRYASDLDPIKPCGECMVVGAFHAPGGRAVTQSKVAFQIGSVQKQLAVFGERAWRMGRASAPEPIVTLPLSWEHAFGGRSTTANPVGRGLEAVVVSGHSRVLLPNVEDPMALIASAEQRPKPAGCGPVPRTWAARARLAGTYDARWQKTRYPWFPEDIDWRYFNAAPPDQRIEGYWRGDEEIVLRHLHPQHALLRCTLPGLRAHAFVIPRRTGLLSDVGLALDTITVDAGEGLVYCIWRGVSEVSREDLSDIDHLYVSHEGPEERNGIAGFTARYRAKLDALAAEALEAAPAPAPASSGLRREALQAAMVAVDAPGAKWAHLDQAQTIRGDDAAIVAALREAMAERQKGDALRPLFENALGFGPPKSEERTLSPEELLELEMQLALGDLLDEEEDPRRAEVRAALAAGESLAGRDLSGVDLSSLDFAGADLSGALLARANLSGSRFERSKLDGANLSEAEISLASFDGCSFVEADLTSVRGQRLRLHECDLSGATLAVSYLREGQFLQCRFVRAILTESDLGQASFRGCNLDAADLSASILEDAVFVDSTLKDAWLERGVKARNLRLDGCDASLLRASEEGDFEGASFKRAMLEGARFGRAKLRGANFSLAKLSRADFSDASLPEAILMGCDLRMARFDRAVLARANLLKSNLMQARFEGADLRDADLRGTNLFQAELWQARTERARLDLADLSGTRPR